MRDRVLVCLVVEEGARWPRSRVGVCEVCGDRIWISKLSPEDVSYLCLECFGELLREKEANGENYTIEPPTKEQLEAIWRDEH